MNGLSYARLEKIMNTVPHFRGNKDRFPLGNRRHNTKYFLVREEDGHKVFDIVYGTYWETHNCDKATYDAKVAEEYPRVHRYQCYDDKGLAIPDEFTYHWYEVKPSVLGTVRPDETFEFTKERYYQGDRTFLTQFSTGWFTTQSRHGGMLYRTGGGKFVPIWQRMKVNIGDMTPTQPYKVVIHHVDRKKSKELLSKYEHFFKVSEVMTKNMTMAMLVATAKEVLDDLYQKEDAHKEWHKSNDLIEAAEKRINDAPLDAFVLYALGYESYRFNYLVRWSNTTTLDNESVDALFMNLKRKLGKELYKLHRDIFKEVEYEGGKAYPACDWGTKIIVDGKEVVQL